MNSEMQIPTTTQEIPTQEKVKKPRKRPLPVKYNQMLVFGYWMLSNMKSEELITSDVLESMMRKLHMFDGTELQIELLDDFIKQYPELNKELKKDVRSKAPPKEKKQTSKETKEKKEKKRPGRPRKEKKIVTVESMDIIAELVAEARREEMAISPETEIEEESEGEEEKEEEEEEEVEVQKFMFSDILYLIDKKNVIYDFTSHDDVGKWNDEKKCIDFF